MQAQKLLKASLSLKLFEHMFCPVFGCENLLIQLSCTPLLMLERQYTVAPPLKFAFKKKLIFVFLLDQIICLKLGIHMCKYKVSNI